MSDPQEIKRFFGLVDSQREAELEARLAEAERDASRWRWLRAQRGWPDTEASAMDQPPEWFDALADHGIAASAGEGQ